MDSKQIESIAADWLARRESGTWSEADDAAFSDWQSRSTAHRIAIIRLKTAWQYADRLQALGAGVPRGHIPSPGQWRISPFFDSKRVPTPIDDDDSKVEGEEGMTETERRALPRLAGRRFRGRLNAVLPHHALAAGIALAVVTAGIAGYLKLHEPNVYRTRIGDTKAVNLADGSHVTLNTDSKIHVALNESERRIELDQGEAFFDVAKDKTRPFVVWAGNKRIVAVGTQFSVRRSGDDVRVVVTQGRVQMTEVHQAKNPDAGAVLLDAGGIAQAGDAGVLVKEASVENAEKYVTWREGFLVFHDTPLIEAVAEFNRYHRVKLVVADPALADLRIGGNLRTTNMEAFVRVLEQGFPVQAKEEGDRILLTAR